MILNKCAARVITSRIYWKRFGLNNLKQRPVVSQKSFVHSRASQSYYSSAEDEAVQSTAAGGGSNTSAAATPEAVSIPSDPLIPPALAAEPVVVADSSVTEAVESLVNSAASVVEPLVLTDNPTVEAVVNSSTSETVSAAAAYVISQQQAVAVEAAAVQTSSASAELASTAVQETVVSTAAEVVAPAVPEVVSSAVAPEAVASTAAEAVASSPVAEVVASTAAVDTSSLLMDALGSSVDPSFIELGLASGHWPHHYLQSLLELVNTGTELPWFATIALGTLIFRVVTLPIFIKQRKYAVVQANAMPEQMELMGKITAAKATDDPMKVQKARENYFAFEKRSGTSQLKGLRNNMAMPVMFGFWIYSLRQMVAVPVPSLDATSFAWIDSLCEADPYMILPVFSGATVGLQVYLSMNATGALASTKNAMVQRYGKYIPVLPIIALPLFFGNSASALLIYIATNSAFTLATSVVMNTEAVKNYLQMPERAVVDSQGRTNKSFGEMWTEMREGSERKYGLKREAREIKREVKQLAKARKKELKGDPPQTFKIGTEAKLRGSYIADFEKDDWIPKRNYVFQR